MDSVIVIEPPEEKGVRKMYDRWGVGEGEGGGDS